MVLGADGGKVRPDNHIHIPDEEREGCDLRICKAGGSWQLKEFHTITKLRRHHLRNEKEICRVSEPFTQLLPYLVPILQPFNATEG